MQNVHFWHVPIAHPLFSINGAASATVDAVDGVASVEVTVNDEVPAVVEASRIKIEADGVVSYQAAAIEDRLIGDVDGDNAITAVDAGYVLAASVGKTVTANGYKQCLANVDGDSSITAVDAGYVLAASVGKDVAAVPGIGVNYVGGNADITVVDPFEGSDTPDEPAEPEAIATPANIYAYAQNGKIYYTFDAVENAAGYDITIGDTIIDVTEATGAFEFAYTEGMTLTVTAKAAEGYADSAASEAITVIKADASGALAAWLAENGLTNVAITVHEIK